MEVLLFALFFISALIFFIAGKDDFGRTESKLIIKEEKNIKEEDKVLTKVDKEDKVAEEGEIKPKEEDKVMAEGKKEDKVAEKESIKPKEKPKEELKKES